MFDRKALIPIYFVCLWYPKHLDSMPLDALSQRMLSLKGLVRSNLAIPPVPRVGILYLDEPLTDVEIAIHDAKKALKNLYDGMERNVNADDANALKKDLISAMTKLEHHEQQRFWMREWGDYQRVVSGWKKKHGEHVADNDGGAEAADLEAQEKEDASRARAAESAEQRAAEAREKREVDERAWQSQYEAWKAAKAASEARALAEEREKERQEELRRLKKARELGAAAAEKRAAEKAARMADEAKARQAQAADEARRAAQEADEVRARQQRMAAEAQKRADREAQEAKDKADQAKARVEQIARDAKLAQELFDDHQKSLLRERARKLQEANDEAIARALQKEMDLAQKMMEEERKRQAERDRTAAEAARAQFEAAERLAQVLEDERVAKELQKKMDEEMAFEFAEKEAAADEERGRREEAAKKRAEEARERERRRRQAEEDKRKADKAAEIAKKEKEWYGQERKWEEVWEVLPTTGRGDCFFHAVIGSAGLTRDHAELRRGLVDFMRNNPDRVIPEGVTIMNLVTADAPNSADPKAFFHEYLDKMRETGTWATDVERAAIQEYLGISLVAVWEPHGQLPIGIPARNLPENDRTIFIYFGMYGHYSSMRRRR